MANAVLIWLGRAVPSVGRAGGRLSVQTKTPYRQAVRRQGRPAVTGCLAYRRYSASDCRCTNVLHRWCLLSGVAALVVENDIGGRKVNCQRVVPPPLVVSMQNVTHPEFTEAVLRCGP